MKRTRAVFSLHYHRQERQRKWYGRFALRVLLPSSTLVLFGFAVKPALNQMALLSAQARCLRWSFPPNTVVCNEDGITIFRCADWRAMEFWINPLPTPSHASNVFVVARTGGAAVSGASSSAPSSGNFSPAPLSAASAWQISPGIDIMCPIPVFMHGLKRPDGRVRLVAVFFASQSKRSGECDALVARVIECGTFVHAPRDLGNSSITVLSRYDAAGNIDVFAGRSNKGDPGGFSVHVRCSNVLNVHGELQADDSVKWTISDVLSPDQRAETATFPTHAW